MIIVCLKAVAGKDNATFEREFLRYYLSEASKKGFLANEAWDSFRFRIKQKYSEKADEIIANFRGIFRPENIRLKENYDEMDPSDYDDDEIRKKTRDLVNRRWADIKYFITQEPDNYRSLKVKAITLEEFYIECMDDEVGRKLIQEFSVHFSHDRQG